MDFIDAAERSQAAAEEVEEDFIEIHIDPPDPETGETNPVIALIPSPEQIAVYLGAMGTSGGIKAPAYMHAVFHLLEGVLQDDGYDRIMRKFEDRKLPKWNVQRLAQITRGLIAEASGRPTEPSSDSSSTSEVAGRSSTATAAPKASTRSRSTRA